MSNRALERNQSDSKSNQPSKSYDRIHDARMEHLDCHACYFSKAIESRYADIVQNTLDEQSNRQIDYEYEQIRHCSSVSVLDTLHHYDTQGVLYTDSINTQDLSPDSGSLPLMPLFPIDDSETISFPSLNVETPHIWRRSLNQPQIIENIQLSEDRSSVDRFKCNYSENEEECTRFGQNSNEHTSRIMPVSKYTPLCVPLENHVVYGHVRQSEAPISHNTPTVSTSVVNKYYMTRFAPPAIAGTSIPALWPVHSIPIVPFQTQASPHAPAISSGSALSTPIAMSPALSAVTASAISDVRSHTTESEITPQCLVVTSISSSQTNCECNETKSGQYKATSLLEKRSTNVLPGIKMTDQQEQQPSHLFSIDQYHRFEPYELDEYQDSHDRHGLYRMKLMHTDQPPIDEICLRSGSIIDQSSSSHDYISHSISSNSPNIQQYTRKYRASTRFDDYTIRQYDNRSTPSMRVQSTHKKDVRLFVGRIPKWYSNEDLKAIFDRFGPVLECYVIRDHRGAQSRGCGFVRFKDISIACKAIKILNQAVSLDLTLGPLQVKFATGELQRLGLPLSLQPGGECVKVFFGNLTTNTTEKELRHVFGMFGPFEELCVLRDQNNRSKLCANPLFALCWLIRKPRERLVCSTFDLLIR